MSTSARERQRAFGTGRITAQRAAIVDSIATGGRAFTIDSLVESTHARDSSIGVATVYRAVSAMEESGWLERVGERNGSVLYARCAQGGHHHHVICTTCGRLELADCPFEALTASVATASGFVMTGHDVTLYGLCPDCAPTRRD